MRLGYFLLLMSAIMLLCGCNSYEVESDWKDREIVIDGDDGEWDESRYIIKKENIVAGVMNDDEFLYFCIYTTDPQMSQKILRQGLMIWLNAEGTKKKGYGIRYPLQMSLQDIKQRSDQDRYSEAHKDFVGHITEKLEIVGPDENIASRYSLHELKGLELSMKNMNGVLVYEIKIPLRYDPTYSFALDTELPSRIMVGFEIEKMDIAFAGIKPDNSDINGKMPGSGRRSVGRGSGGERQKPSNREMPDTSVQELWLKVSLASK
jgi:hypothetical protein